MSNDVGFSHKYTRLPEKSTGKLREREREWDRERSIFKTNISPPEEYRSLDMQ